MLRMLSILRPLAIASLMAFCAALAVPILSLYDWQALAPVLNDPLAVITGGGLMIGVAVDKVKNLAAINVANTAQNGIRQFTQMDNNVRTERLQFRLTGQVDITGAGTGIVNRGALSAALQEIGFSDGGTDIEVLDGRCARQLGEILAPSPLPAVRLAGAGVQAATLLEEIVPIFFSAYRTANPNETKWVEVNKQLQQQPFINPLRLITRLATGAGLVGTITNLVASIQQVYDEMVGIPPWISPYVRQVTQDVPGANAQLKVDLRGTRYCRGILIQQDTSGVGEVADIINGLVLRGDKKSIIGDNAVPFRDLQQAQAYEYGGAIPDGYLWIDFARYGRLSTLWNPNQDTNLRLELNVQPSVTVGAVSSLIRVVMVEYEQTAATALPPNVNI